MGHRDVGQNERQNLRSYPYISEPHVMIKKKKCMSGIHNLVVIYALKQFLRDKKKGVVGVGIMHTTCIFKLLIRGVHLSSGFVQICLSVSR